MKIKMEMYYHTVKLVRGEDCKFGIGEYKRPLDIPAKEFYKERNLKGLPHREYYGRPLWQWKFGVCRLKRETEYKIIASKEVEVDYLPMAIEMAKEWQPHKGKRIYFGKNLQISDFAGEIFTDLSDENDNILAQVHWGFHDAEKPKVAIDTEQCYLCQATKERKTIIHQGKPITVYRVKAMLNKGKIKCGDKGGWVDNATELDSTSWIGGEAIVINSKVSKSKITGGTVYDSVIKQSKITGGLVCKSNLTRAKVHDNATVMCSDASGKYFDNATLYNMKNYNYDYSVLKGNERRVQVANQNDVYNLFALLKAKE